MHSCSSDRPMMSPDVWRRAPPCKHSYFWMQRHETPRVCRNHKALAGLQHIATESKVKGLSRLLWGHELSMIALVRLGQ